MDKKSEIEARARLTFQPEVFFNEGADMPIIQGDGNATALVQRRIRDNLTIGFTTNRYSPWFYAAMGVREQSGLVLD